MYNTAHGGGVGECGVQAWPIVLYTTHQGQDVKMAPLSGTTQGTLHRYVLLPHLINSAFFGVSMVVCEHSRSWYTQSHM